MTDDLTEWVTKPEQRVNWRDRDTQPHCNICGRFAYWDTGRQEWRLRCVYWDDYTASWEHE